MRQARAAGDRAADRSSAAPTGGRSGSTRVDGVVVGERGRRRGAERRQRPAAVGDPVRPRALALAGEEDEREVARAAGVGRYQAGTSTRSGSIRSMSITPRAEVALLAAAAEHEGPRAAPRLARAAARARGRRRSGARRRARPRARRRRPGRSSTATAPSRLSAATTAERARPRAHQHADVLALAHADRQQAADDVVDPPLDRVVRRRRGPRTGRRRRRARARPARRAAARARPGCPGSSWLEPRQPRQLAGASSASAARRRRPAGGTRPPSARARRRRPAASSSPTREPVPAPGASGSGSSSPDAPDLRRQLALPGAPARPVGDRRARWSAWPREPTTRPKWPARSATS